MAAKEVPVKRGSSLARVFWCLLGVLIALTIWGLPMDRTLGTGMQLQRGRVTGEPPATAGFDWKAYLDHYPELLQPPHAIEYSEQAAWRHFRTIGRAEGRVATRLMLRLRYTGANASPGLTNQLLAHLAAFMIAHEAGAEVVVPPFISRSAFVTGTAWQWQSAESVFDLGRMAEYWRPRGLVIHRTPELSAAQKAGFPKLLERNDPATALYGDQGCATAALPSPAPHLQTVAQRARRAAVFVAENWLRENGTAPYCVNVDTGHIFFRVPVSSDQALALALFRGFFFNRTIVNLAAAVRKEAGGNFHAAHLRIEDDAQVWNKRDGGASGALQEYIKAMRNASFTSNTTVYVASGLLYNGSSPEFDQVVHTLRNASVAGRVVYKEQDPKQALLTGLHSEQLALVDLLVMAGARAFVGHPFSTMSVIVEQLRINAGFPPESNAYISVWEQGVHANYQHFVRFVRFAHEYRPRVRNKR